MSTSTGETTDALKLTSYFGERTRAGGELLADALLDLHARHGIRASVLLRGIQGFGAKHRLRSDRLLTLSEDLPVLAIAFDARDRVEALADDLTAIHGEGLLTLERARIGDRSELPPLPAHPGSEVKLTIFLGRHQRVAGEPAFAFACETLHRHGVAGATVLLGVDGTVAGQRRRARFFARNRGVPLLVISVGEAAPIAAATASIAARLPTATFVLERVRVCKRDGVLTRKLSEDSSGSALAAPRQGHGDLQKLTVVLSEAARHGARPAYLELVRRLRAAGAAGATSLRGIWGFHGDHPPHGDRLLALRRHVPVLTELIDTPERVGELFSIVDELTSERGLVTSESVPGSTPLRSAPGL